MGGVWGWSVGVETYQRVSRKALPQSLGHPMIGKDHTLCYCLVYPQALWGVRVWDV